MMANMDASTIIDALGGTGKVANLCGITPGSVSQWRNKGIPQPWAKFLRAARPKTFIRLEREAAARARAAEQDKACEDQPRGRAPLESAGSQKDGSEAP